MKTDQVAINTVSLADAPLDEICRACAGAGFRNVEFPLPRVKAWMRDGRTESDVRKLLDDSGLRCVGGFESSLELWSGDERRRKSEDLILSNAGLLAALSGGVLVIGTDAPAHKSVDALPELGRAMRALADRFPPSVSLALEFNWSALARSLHRARLAVAEADHPRVGILFDPAHYHCTPSRFEDLTPAAVSRFGHVHVNDMRDKPGDLSDCNADRVLPGQGILDVRRLLGRIEELGYRGYFSIEMFSAELWALPPAEAARRCYESMAALAES